MRCDGYGKITSSGEGNGQWTETEPGQTRALVGAIRRVMRELNLGGY